MARDPTPFFEELSILLASVAWGDLQAVAQLELKGASEAAVYWHVVIKDGAAEVEQGRADTPSFTLHAHVEDFLDLHSGAATVRASLVDGRLRISGDLAKAMQVGPKLFEAKG